MGSVAFSARRSRARSAAIALLCLAAGACAPSTRTLARKAFWRHDYETAQKLFAESKDVMDKNYVLHQLEWGSAAFERGDYAAAREAFERAAQVMRGYGGTAEGLVSLIANESAKLFKGDPFEQAMANFYDGLIYYQRADYGNARAGFHQSLMADKSSAENCREDFAVSQFFIGKCYQRMDQPDNARITFEKARKVYTDNPYFSDDAVESHNLLIVLQLGRAPEKTRSGPGGSLDTYRRGHYRETSARVYANGTLLGRSFLAVDLLHQAQTSGRSTKDAIQAAKGAVKTGLMAAAVTEEKPSLGLVLVALLFPSAADIRQWDLLPGEIHLVTARLEPGTYTFKIEFLDDDIPLPDFQQVWHDVPVIEDHDTLLVFRSGRGRPGGCGPPWEKPTFSPEMVTSSAGAAATE